MKNYLFFGLLFGLLGCAAPDDRKPYLIQILSTEVNPSSFDQVQIQITPRSAAESFEMITETLHYFNDAVRVTTASRDLVLTIDANWFRSGSTPFTGETIRMNFPIYAEAVGEDAPSETDPSVTVYFLNNSARIAEGTSSLSWPLPDGQTSPPVLVTCKENVTSTCMTQ